MIRIDSKEECQWDNGKEWRRMIRMVQVQTARGKKSSLRKRKGQKTEREQTSNVILPLCSCTVYTETGTKNDRSKHARVPAWLYNARVHGQEPSAAKLGWLGCLQCAHRVENSTCRLYHASHKSWIYKTCSPTSGSTLWCPHESRVFPAKD